MRNEKSIVALFLHEVNLNLGTSFTSFSDFRKVADEASAKLISRWVDSGRTDYSIYEDPEYIYDTLMCYKAISSGAVTGAERYFRAHNIKKGKALDIYNGAGLTSIQAIQAGFDCEALNTNPAQVTFMNNSSRRILGRDITTHKDLAAIPDESFDTVFSLEVFEHFKSPVDHVKETLRVLKTGGYLVEGTGFTDPELLGHFDVYEINSAEIGNRAAGKYVQRLIKQTCIPVMSGFNRKPRIHHKVGADKIHSYKWPDLNFGFRGLVRNMKDLGLDPDFIT